MATTARSVAVLLALAVADISIRNTRREEINMRAFGSARKKKAQWKREQKGRRK